eukprot:1905957-Pyramimonas_sp.AAC.1
MNSCAELAQQTQFDLWIQRTNAHNNIKSGSVRISSAAVPQPELRAKIDSTSRYDSKNTNSFVNPARIADRVQTSECDRRTHMMSPNRFL